MRKPLTPQEILEIDRALTEAFSSLRALRQRIPEARYIKFPQVPALLAESIVIVAVDKIFGSGWIASYGGRSSDVRLTNSSGETRRVEVKSTGLNGFQELKAKDLLADTLVWIHFGDRFEEGSAPIQVAILENPGKYIQQPIRLDIPRLQRKIGSTPDLRRIEIRHLGEFLR